MNIRIESGAGRDFKVIERMGCQLAYGGIPLTAVSEMAVKAPEGTVISPHLARLAEATMAFGLPDDIDRLCESMADEVLARTQLKHWNNELSEAALHWLALGEQGVSSQVMFRDILGVMPAMGSASEDNDTPRDPDDLRRCRLLVEAVPEIQDNLARLKRTSAAWMRLVDRWAEVCRLMDEEAPNWRNQKGEAPRTHAMLKEIDGREV